jgi:hypothetical protein
MRQTATSAHEDVRSINWCSQTVNTTLRTNSHKHPRAILATLWNWPTKQKTSCSVVFNLTISGSPQKSIMQNPTWSCLHSRRSENDEAATQPILVAVRLLKSRIRIPLEAGMFVSCVCCVGSGLCDGWSLVQRSPTARARKSACDQWRSLGLSWPLAPK